MKVCFLTSSPNIDIGSYRIWVNDLSKTISDIGNESIICINDLDDQKYDAIILCKSAYKCADKIKDKFKNIKVGAINIPSNYQNPNIDFVIVGSYEEKCSLSFYKNVFVYPLIERQFQNIERKIHKKEDITRICFHGHFPHLAKFEPFLRSAIESISGSGNNIELVVITGDSRFDWKHGKPKNVKVEMHQYDQKTITEIIKSCDIGVVPNVTDMRLYNGDVQKQNSVEYGLYSTDYFLRFKNKTNAGRAFVFYQHGIPVIHDLSPSSFEFMGKCENKIVAHDTASWCREILYLMDHNTRNTVSKENFDVFNNHYDPHDHAKKLVKFIGDIHNE